MQNEPETVDKGVNNQIENDEQKYTYNLRRIAALVLVILTIVYILSHDNNKTLEIIMLSCAGFFIGASILDNIRK